MLGDDTRFLTGTDEHSRQHRPVGRSAEGRTPREFVDEKVELFRAAEDALLISPDRFIRTTDPDHYRSAQEMVRRAYDNGDIYLGTYEGWYCPNEGFMAASDLLETARGMQCPQPPRRRAPVADRAQLVLPPVGVPGSAARALRAAPRLRAARLPAQRDAGLHPPGPRGLLDQPRRRGVGDPVPDRGERRDGPARGRLVGPRGGHDLRLVRRADQLHHRRGLPRRPRGVPVTGGRRTCTSSARTSPASTRSTGRPCCGRPGIEAPRHVWVHGWLLVAAASG